MNDLLITNVAPRGHEPGDVSIRAGRIERIARALTVQDDVPVLDGSGQILLPSFVDAHSHLDKSLVGMPWFPRRAGRALPELLADERALRRTDAWNYERQIGRNARVMIANGATYTRAFVDIDTDAGLRGFEAMQAVKHTYADALTIQIVAFPQSGVTGRPGTDTLMAQALADGADIVGGIDPCLRERDPVRHLDWLFALAETHDAGIDVHLHEMGTMGAFSAELIAERTRAHGLAGKVVISHPDFLGDIAPSHAHAIIDDMVAAGIAVTTNAPPTAKAPLRYMIEAGLTIGAGCDGECDSWAPMNRSDMLFKAYQLALHNGLTADSELDAVLDLITIGGAHIMSIDDYGLDVGGRADLVMLPAETAAEALVALPTRRTVIKNGRVIAVDGEYLLS